MKPKAGETYTWSVRKVGASRDGAATSTFKAKGAAASAK
jgi:hypothetical protein